MPIDLAAETLIPFSAAAKRLPRLRNDRPVSPNTIWRWATRGLHGVKLESVSVGTIRCTSVEALDRFLRAINAPADLAAPARTDSRDVRRQEEVERELDQAGV
jgi:hypothetical protein